MHNGSKAGDFFFMGTGSVISKGVELGDNVKIAANSAVTKSFQESNITLAGQPAIIRKQSTNTWIDDYDGAGGTQWKTRYNKIIELKQKMRL